MKDVINCRDRWGRKKMRKADCQKNVDGEGAINH